MAYLYTFKKDRNTNGSYKKTRYIDANHIRRVTDINKNYTRLKNNSIYTFKFLEKYDDILEYLTNYNNIGKIEICSKEIYTLGILNPKIQLVVISIYDTSIEDITPLFQIKSLQKLQLYCNNIKSIKGIGNLSNLIELSLNEYRVKYTADLYKCERLQILNITGSGITDIKFVTKIRKLKKLHLPNKIVNIIYVASLNNLQYITFGESYKISSLIYVNTDIILPCKNQLKISDRSKLLC